MQETPIHYVYQTPEGGWRISGSRVSLDSVVHGYWEGLSPEAIQDDFPSLTLEQVHGALAFYLHHRQELDSYLQKRKESWEAFRQQSETAHAPLLAKLRANRRPALQDNES